MSVRAISTGVLVAIALLSAAVAGGVSWLSLSLERTSDVLTRDARSILLITETELNLFAYQQASNLRLVTNDPRVHGEADAARAELAGAIRAALEAAREYAGSSAELDLLEDAESEIEAYFAARAELESRGLDFDAVWSESRALIAGPTETLEALRAINEHETERAHANALATSRAVRAGAVGTAAVGMLMLAAIALWIRRALLRPIVAIRDAIERYREGEEPPPLGEGMPRELDEIASAFEAMRATLARRRGEQAAFLAGVAHELRNPIFALQASSTVLSHAVTDRARNAVIIMERQLAHLARLVDELIEIGRTTAGKLELEIGEIDLRDCVRSVLDLYRPLTGNHSVELSLPDERTAVLGDAARIEQVIGNLLSNAVKYSPDGGVIRVSVSATADDACIAVSDEGIGIPRSEIGELFAPFRRRSTDRHGIPGAGLGLFVVKRIVAAHRGKIEVESEPDRGSVFRVWLPRVRTETAAA